MSKTNDFFVMLNLQNGGITPMTTGDDDELAVFATEQEAMDAAKQTAFGEHFGYEVFERGTGSA